MAVDILIDLHLALRDDCIHRAVAYAGSVVMAGVEAAVLDEHARAAPREDRRVPLLAREADVLDGRLEGAGEVDAFIPIAELAIANPRVLDVFHGEGAPTAVVDAVLVMDEFLGVAGPIAGEANPLDAALLD